MPNTTTNRRKPDARDDRREGYELAITMLRDLEASTDLCDKCGLSIPATQDNIVYRYLVKCRARSLDAEAGFCAVLSDFVADCSEGFTPKSGTYEKALKIRAPAKRNSAASEKLRTWKMIGRVTGKDYGPMPADFGTPGWAKKQRDAA
jgi:hypothetical protein